MIAIYFNVPCHVIWHPGRLSVL